MILRAEHIDFAYRPGRAVLRDVSVEVWPGKVTALFGPNGCGKSTLLRCLNASLRPQGGRIVVNGRDAVDLTPRQLARQVAVVPQDSPVDVPFTASQMVMLGRYAHWGLWGQESPEDRRVVAESLARAGAGDLADRSFAELSGGERQRVIIARALAQQGKALLLDEPTSHLDISHQLDLYRLVRSLAQEGQAVLMVCHDIFLAPMFVETAILMSSGRIHSIGAVTDVLTRPNLASTYGVETTIAWNGTSTLQAVFHQKDDPSDMDRGPKGN